MAPTYWNGRPARCRRLKVKLGNSGRFSKLWHADRVGDVIEAVEVKVIGERVVKGAVIRYEHAPFYIDDTDGMGWKKVTEGRGSPVYGHRELDVAEIIEVSSCGCPLTSEEAG